jgi:hypothetical protein
MGKLFRWRLLPLNIDNMKRSICLLLVVIMFVACQREASKNEDKVQEEKGATVKEAEKLLVLPWTATYNPESGEMELKNNPESDASKLTIQDMVDAINIKYPQIILSHQRKHNDTLDVSIENASYLTQQIGTAGAQTYFAEATFALTELKGIHAVQFLFKEGDHAVPKTYSRASFKDFN